MSFSDAEINENIPSAAQYNGEDNDIPDDWDASDEEVKPEPVKVEKPKTKKNTIAQKIQEKERKEREMKKKLAENSEKPTNEKERERLAGDLEYELFKEEFEVKNNKNDHVSGIDDFQYKSREDFEKLRERLKKKLLPLEVHTGYTSFLESTFRDLVVSVDVESLKKFSQMFAVLANEKAKTLKTTTKKKKSTKGKLVKDRGYDFQDDDYEGVSDKAEDDWC